MTLQLPQRQARWRSIGSIPVKKSGVDIVTFWAMLLFGSLALLHLSTLLRFPAPYVDEGWFTSRAWGLLQSGKAVGSLDAGVFLKYDGHWTYFSIFGILFPAVSIKLFGLSLLSARIVSLIFGLALLAAVYTIGTKLIGRGAGILTALLTGLSSAYFSAAHLARPDIMIAAAGFGAIALYLSDQGEKLSIKSLLCGLLLGLAFEIHPNIAIYGPVVLMLFVLDFGRHTLSIGRFWGFAGGTCLGLALFPILHILPYPQTFFSLTELFFGDTRVPPGLSFDNQRVFASLADTALLLAHFSGPKILLIPLAIAALLRRRGVHRKEIKILTLLAGLLLGFILFIPYKPGYYGILLSPAIDIVLSAFLVKLAVSQWRSSRTVYALTIIAWTLTAAAVILAFYPLRVDAYLDYERTVDRLHQSVPKGSIIMGEPKYWFGFPNHPYYGWQQLTFYRSYAPSSTVEEAFSAHSPEYLIIDSPMLWHLTDDPSKFQPWAQLFYLPKTEFNAFLRDYAELVDSFQTETSGTVSVYRIHPN